MKKWATICRTQGLPTWYFQSKCEHQDLQVAVCRVAAPDKSSIANARCLNPRMAAAVMNDQFENALLGKAALTTVGKWQ